LAFLDLDSLDYPPNFCRDMVQSSANNLYIIATAATAS